MHNNHKCKSQDLLRATTTYHMPQSTRHTTTTYFHLPLGDKEFINKNYFCLAYVLFCNYINSIMYCFVQLIQMIGKTNTQLVSFALTNSRQ